jgi:hypothetical protein
LRASALPRTLQLHVHAQRADTFEWRLKLVEEQTAASEKTLGVGLAKTSGLARDTSLALQALEREIQGSISGTLGTLAAETEARIAAIDRRLQLERDQRDDEARRTTAELQSALGAVSAHGRKWSDEICASRAPVDAHDLALHRLEAQHTAMHAKIEGMERELRALNQRTPRALGVPHIDVLHGSPAASPAHTSPRPSTSDPWSPTLPLTSPVPPPGVPCGVLVSTSSLRSRRMPEPGLAPLTPRDTGLCTQI